MKNILSFILLGMTLLSLHAFADGTTRSMQVRGDKARDLMEALAGAGFKMQAGSSFSSQPITIQAPQVSCLYTAAVLPDEWMSDAKCWVGDEDQQGTPLANPLALAKAMGAVSEADSAAGSRYLTLSGISCVLSYDSKAYSCTVSQTDYSN